MVSLGHDQMNIVYSSSLINQLFLLTTYILGYRNMNISEWKHNWRPGLLGYLYVLCTVALFFRRVSWKEGPMNLEVSKSHSRCVATRQLIPEHQLTFFSVHQHCMACTK